MVVGAIIAAGIPVIAQAVIQSEVSRAQLKSPKIRPGEFLRLALEIQALSESGLSPVLSVDPFTGATVLSTTDQSGVLFNILGEKFAREALAGTPEESAVILQAREQFIQSRRVAAVAAPTVPTLREEVVGVLAPSTAKLVAPGVVAKKSSGVATPSRLGGPCAAANTGFSRLNCARGGFA